MAKEIKEELENLLLTMKGKRIAVVGNAIVKKYYGKNINSYDEVIRFNNFEIKGYEELIGTKITRWCVHPYVTNRWHHYSSVLSSRKSPTYNVGGTVIVPKHDLWAEYRKNTGKTLSSGVTILKMFDNLGIKVNAYGFDHFQTGHYWDINYQRKEFHSADYEIEFKKTLTNIKWNY